MTNLYRMLIAPFVALVAATSFAEATCGDLGGPGYRAPNGKCVSWEALGRVCGSPPSTRCTDERPAPEAPDAARKGQEIEEQKKRQHEFRAKNKNGSISGKPDYTRAVDQARRARNVLARSADTTARRGIA
jgi:hypothetical protein